MSSSPATEHRRREIPPPFGRVVCGIDGSRSSPVAVEQAVALSGPGTALVFVCVREARGAGATRQTTISAERADAALEDAVAVAREAGIDAAAEILPGHDPRTVLLDEASRSDLLVVASHGGSRAGGIALGSTASAAVHRAAVPVLVARRPPAAVDIPKRIHLATDGSPDAARAVELTARIGHRNLASVYLLSVDPDRTAIRPMSQSTRWISPRHSASSRRFCACQAMPASASSRWPARSRSPCWRWAAAA
jgi:nucleotide-binding universal stress UspA family protein